MLPGFNLNIPPGPDLPKIVNAIVEIPKGRRCKFEIDKETGLFKLDRYLYSSAMYPGDYGFIPQTLAEDGDPLDVLVMVNEPTFTGCLIEARPLGLFKMTDNDYNDFKVLAVPGDDPIFSEYDDLWRVPPHFLREVEHFFSTYKQLEGTVVEPLGWDTADRARKEILACADRYQQIRTSERARAHSERSDRSEDVVAPEAMKKRSTKKKSTRTTKRTAKGTKKNTAGGTKKRSKKKTK